VLVIQDDQFDATDSITVCLVTSDPTEIPLLRIPLASEQTGLTEPSNIMVDKVTTIPRSKLGEYVGAVSDTTMVELSRALIVFFGMA
jgi:mRNA interferase MazF